MKVCIIYGWAEGQWHGKALRRALKDAGYSIIKDPKQADIIVAHSAGCYLIPDSTKVHLILLVGLPYWPKKHPAKSTMEKLINEPKDLFWYHKTIYNIYYLLTRPTRWLKMKGQWGEQSLLFKHNANVILLFNDKDPYLNQAEGKLLAKYNGWQFKTLTGYHDDLWIRPEKYIDIIKSSLS